LKVVVVFSVLLFASIWCDGAAVTADTPSSTLMPLVGQTAHYRFSDTVKTPGGTRNLAGTLTLATLAPDQIRVSITLEGKGTRSFDLHADQTGALWQSSGSEPSLQAPSARSRRSSSSSEPSVTEQELIRRLSLVARIGAHPSEDASFPVVLDVPWASGPVDPLLTVKSDPTGVFTADATQETSVNPPARGRAHILRSVLISAGVGVAASQIGGVAGRVVGPVVSIGSLVIASRNRSGASPTDVRLHITGKISAGRLQTVSGAQEYAVHAGGRSRTYSDTWSLVLEGGTA
jgi:hypothetical protein